MDQSLKEELIGYTNIVVKNKMQHTKEQSFKIVFALMNIAAFFQRHFVGTENHPINAILQKAALRMSTIFENIIDYHDEHPDVAFKIDSIHNGIDALDGSMLSICAIYRIKDPRLIKEKIDSFYRIQKKKADSIPT